MTGDVQGTMAIPGEKLPLCFVYILLLPTRHWSGTRHRAMNLQIWVEEDHRELSGLVRHGGEAEMLFLLSLWKYLTEKCESTFKEKNWKRRREREKITLQHKRWHSAFISSRQAAANLLCSWGWPWSPDLLPLPLKCWDYGHVLLHPDCKAHIGHMRCQSK